MYMHECMHTRVITAHPDMSILDAQKVMHDNHIRRLPVVKGGRLVGLLTEGKLRQSLAPYTAYSLSTWEFNWMLSRTKVKDVMHTKVITVTPDTPVEEALTLAQERGIGTIPVVDNDVLVGICTTTDISNLIIKAMGLGKPGAHLHLSGHVDGDWIGKVINVVRSHKAPIKSLFTITPPRTGQEEIIIHIDATDVTAIVNELRVQGYEIKSISGASNQLWHVESQPIKAEEEP